MHWFTHALVFGHIIIGAQCTHHHVRDVTTAINEECRSKGRQKGLELHHRGDFLQNHYMFESVHDGDHDSV